MADRFGVKREKPEKDSEGTEVETNESPNEFIGTELVLYTDGGCRPSRGFGGFGMHGYFFKNEKPKQGAGCKLTPTDQGYVDEKVNAVTVLNYVDFWSTIPGEATNNMAELKAVIEAATVALETKAKSLLVLSDSKITIQGVTEWLPGWKNRGWKKPDGEPPANVELWKVMDELLTSMHDADVKFEIRHVYGHNGDFGNELADDRATRGVILCMEGVTKRHMSLRTAKGYWNPKQAPNRFLGKSCWYFSSNTDSSTYLSHDGRYVYMMGKHGSEDRFLAKRVSDSSYAVVYLKEPDMVLEGIRARQGKLTTGSSIVIGRMDTIRQPNNYYDFYTNGAIYLTKDPKTPNVDLITPSNVQITKEMKPAQLAYRAIDQLSVLDDLLEMFIKKEKDLTVTEITDRFYIDETNKKGVTKTIFNSEIKQADKHIEAEVKLPFKDDTEEHIKLLFDMDLPSRNVISSLADQDPKVYVVTYVESDQSYRFATIVESAENIGIWSSVHSNLKLKQSARIGK